MMSPAGRRRLLAAIAAFGVVGCACVLLMADGGNQEAFLMQTQLAYTYAPEVLLAFPAFPEQIGLGAVRRLGAPNSAAKRPDS